MNRHNDAMLGLELFYQGVKEGSANPTISYYAEYAYYLSNGGTPSGWEELTMTDLNLISAFRKADREQELEALSRMIANSLSHIFTR